MRQHRVIATRFLPLIIAAGMVVGILIGSFYANHFAGNRLNIINTSSNKVNDILHLIDDEYVDSVNLASLVEKALPQILRELDPHSVYISAADAESSMQDLRGSFSGIGVQFIVFEDTVNVVKVVEGGPSEGSNILPGDRIVFADGKDLTGKNMTTDSIMKSLKGAEGSIVKLLIKRKGEKKLIPVNITRGSVPVHSIDVVYMLNKTTGYIRVNTFSETTYSEFLAALASLSRQDFKDLVIDLRGNLGGYMQPAIQMANEFLPKNRLVVYTQGRRSPREDFRSDGRGSYQEMPLVVLVDEFSASASEIFAGAMQDNDRATIIGRRSFGKGLVQVPIEFRDGSMVRLTKARYYTPSGRCVQKPYKPGDNEKYDMDLVSREMSGEYFSVDSIKTSGEKYKTVGGRIVYGGGGIIPDVFVPHDTINMTSYFKEAYIQGLIQKFAYLYVDNNRQKLAKRNDLPVWLPKQNLPELFAAYAEKQGLRRRGVMLHTSRPLFERYLGHYILDDVLGVKEAVKFANQTDPIVNEAIKVLQKK